MILEYSQSPRILSRSRQHGFLKPRDASCLDSFLTPKSLSTQGARALYLTQTLISIVYLFLESGFQAISLQRGHYSLPYVGSWALNIFESLRNWESVLSDNVTWKVWLAETQSFIIHTMYVKLFSHMVYLFLYLNDRLWRRIYRRNRSCANARKGFMLSTRGPCWFIYDGP